MASALSNRSTRLVSSILRFLKDELDKVTPEQAESLEVSIQCLRLAYDVTEEDSDEPSLLDIYIKAVPQEEIKPISEEQKAEAEKLKQQGNEFMKKEMFDEAVASYTKAIDVDSMNAVYYCNRAAAYTGLENHESALNDCKKALIIDSKYSKAYSRMGLTYSKLENYEQALECYERALKLDPTNEGYRKNMQIAKEKLDEIKSNMTSGPGMPDLSQIFQNPALMNMAQQVMSDPNMQRMAMNMMGGFMGRGQGEEQSAEPQQSGDSAQTVPDISDMLQMGQQFASQVSQQHPELIENLRNQMNRPPGSSDNTESEGN
ncbi:small glutamine-rich tetratricopeptide repeat-containing protein beta-like [Styela clava]